MLVLEIAGGVVLGGLGLIFVVAVLANIGAESGSNYQFEQEQRDKRLWEETEAAWQAQGVEEPPAFEGDWQDYDWWPGRVKRYEYEQKRARFMHEYLHAHTNALT